MNRCKHGLIEGTCSLCLGMKPARLRQRGDNPNWVLTEKRLIVYSKYISEKGAHIKDWGEEND